MTEQRYGLTSKGKLALAVARLERAWDDVPPPLQQRLIAAIGQLADDFGPAARQPRRTVRVPLAARCAV